MWRNCKNVKFTGGQTARRVINLIYIGRLHKKEKFRQEFFDIK